MDTRHANKIWTIGEQTGNVPTWERVGIAVLMDLRDELQRLNRLLACPQFLSIPSKLEAIRHNTRQPRKRNRRRSASK